MFSVIIRVVLRYEFYAVFKTELNKNVIILII